MAKKTDNTTSGGTKSGKKSDKSRTASLTEPNRGAVTVPTVPDS